MFYVEMIMIGIISKFQLRVISEFKSLLLPGSQTKFLLNDFSDVVTLVFLFNASNPTITISGSGASFFYASAGSAWEVNFFSVTMQTYSFENSMKFLLISVGSIFPYYLHALLTVMNQMTMPLVPMHLLSLLLSL